MLASRRLSRSIPDPKDARLNGTYRFERGGWISVHLQGASAQIGYEYGYLLAS